MSDRPQGSVRTGSRSGEATGVPTGAPTGPAAPAAADPPVPPTGTQAIPVTGTQRAAGAPAEGTPVAGPQVAVPPGGGAVAGGTAAAAAGAKSRPGRPAGRGPRRARLQLRHIDTWSALKISLVLSIALFFIWMVAVGVLYGVLNALGVFDTLNELFGQLGTDGEASAAEVLTPGIVFGGAAVIGAINIVLLTALCTVGTFIYNMCSDLVGGLELTLSERD